MEKCLISWDFCGFVVGSSVLNCVSLFHGCNLVEFFFVATETCALSWESVVAFCTFHGVNFVESYFVDKV